MFKRIIITAIYALELLINSILKKAKTEADKVADTVTEAKPERKDYREIFKVKSSKEESNLSFREMVLNKATFQVSIGGKILPKITRQEFAILELLLRNPKQVFSKEEIFEYAWDEPYMGETKTLDVHISNIRKKIKTVTSEEYIETVWGIGYRLHL